MAFVGWTAAGQSEISKGKWDGRLTEDYVVTNVAFNAIKERPCPCERQCLRQLDENPWCYDNSIGIVKLCREDIRDCDFDTRYRFLRSKFDASIVINKASEVGEDFLDGEYCQPATVISSARNLASNGQKRKRRKRLQHKWYLNTPFGSRIQVCRSAWCTAYGISHAVLDGFSDQYKRGLKEIDSEVLGDKSRPAMSYAEMQKMAERHGLDLDTRHIQAAIMPKSREALLAFVWLELYFNQYGDHAPNAAGEIHLDPIEKKTIWEEYVRDITEWYPGERYYSYSKLLELWDLLFPFVSIRVYKAVTGKCNCCALICGLRWTYRDHVRRNLLKELHTFHRGSFMKERMSYYDRKSEALEHPDSIMSIIVDGMSQNHCALPWMSNQKEFGSTLTQHLQGVLEHGRRLVFYRTFHNLPSNANLVMHVFLCHLEHWQKAKGSFPDKVFLQIDGGSENANKYLLALCELLTHLQIVPEIVVTRLPVGHTHEDIDAKFAKLWVAFRNCSISTPQDYKAKILETFKNHKTPVEVIDLFAIPDYCAWFEDGKCIDPVFNRWSKEEKTQHQWKFERVEVSEYFPNGVRILYRAFASDEIVEIVKSVAPHTSIAGRFVGLKAIRVQVHWYPVYDALRPAFAANTSPNYPRQDDGTNSRPDGMYLLRSLPKRLPGPEPFIPGSRAMLENTLRCVAQTFTSSSGDKTIRDWNVWASRIAPIDDNVDTYLAKFKLPGDATNGLHIPLKYFFLGMKRYSAPAHVTVGLRKRSLGDISSLELFRAGQGVEFTNCPVTEPARVLVDESTVLAGQARTTKFHIRLPNYQERKYTNSKLADILKRRSLPASGSKAELISRLAFSDEQELSKRLDIQLLESEMSLMYELLDKAREARSVEARSEVYVTAGGCIITNKNLSRLDWRHPKAIDKWLDDEIINIMSHCFFMRAVKARKRILARQRKASKRPAASTSMATSSSSGGTTALQPPVGGGTMALALAASSIAASSSSGGATALQLPAREGALLTITGLFLALLYSIDSCPLTVSCCPLHDTASCKASAASSMATSSSSGGADPMPSGLPAEVSGEVTQDSGSVRFFYSNFFYRLFDQGFDRALRFFRRFNIFQQRLLFVPIHKDFHWMLLVVLVEEKIISFYDSCFGDGDRYLNAMLDCLEREAVVRPNPRAGRPNEPDVMGCPGFNRAKWKLRCIDRQSMPGQVLGDSYNCGVYVITLMDLISADLPLLFDHDDIELCRKRLCLHIIDLKDSDPSDDLESVASDSDDDA